MLTLGCAKNTADSRALQSQLEAQGFVFCADFDDADFILLNTCAFIEAAVEESLDAILDLAELQRVKTGAAKLIVVGCLPSRYGAELASELPEVTAFVTAAEEPKLAAILKTYLSDSLALPSPETVKAPPVATQDLPWAYVKISDGCSRHCSYCTIPTIRGAYHSYSFSDINTEIGELVTTGIKEIILIGQDTGIWSAAGLGDDSLPSPHSLADLLDRLAADYPQTWFRVMYLQPEGISKRLLEVMAAHENIARYLDIPLQHANARILAAMNRKGSGQDYLQMLGEIRASLPGVTLRTTVMVGFPGESQAEYLELRDFIEQARFDYVGIFAYSAEEGTVAAALPDRVDTDVSLERLQDLRNVADSIGFEKVEAQIGMTLDVLICGEDEEAIYGRTKSQAPEVDGIAYIPTDGQPSLDSPNLQPGTIVNVCITDTVLYDLFVEINTEEHVNGVSDL